MFSKRTLRELEDELDAKENNNKTKKELYRTDRIAMVIFSVIVLLTFLFIRTII